MSIPDTRLDHRTGNGGHGAPGGPARTRTAPVKLESVHFRGHFHYAAFGAQLSNWRS
jgi:hypothetical protein